MTAIRSASALLAALLLAACTHQPSASSSPAGTSESASPSVASPTYCPDPEHVPGNACLGELSAGTYTTTRLRPALTYTVSDGWANYEDLPGQFLLLPPGADVRGVDPGTSDYLGVYTFAAAPLQDCSGRPDGAVRPSADAYVAWLRTNRSLKVTEPTPATVGSHPAIAVAVSLRPGQGPCSDPEMGIDHFAEFAVGVAPADFSAAVTATLSCRVIAFDDEQGVGVGLVLIAIPQASSGDTTGWVSFAEQVIGSFEI